MNKPKYKILYLRYKAIFDELLKGLKYLDVFVEDKTIEATNAFRTDRIIALKNGNKQFAVRMEIGEYE